jgi:hypothetical protein
MGGGISTPSIAERINFSFSEREKNIGRSEKEIVALM